ncbi:hypothetical protein CO660_05330 [Rhizobium sp. L9]|uniref:calcium-binding protein n=1 Tax=Rhizobium sp. L9 TaxID=1340738 RepID=UPI000BEAC910|nr:calcium-binding protein [Rhizobium sp. L9]PDT30769.1 hypothetical protein CO660_05330 [Rhizobium sp. L9]
MGIQDVLAKLVFEDAVGDEKGRIETLITDLYRLSPTARTVFDVVAAGTQLLTFKHVPNTMKSEESSFLVKYDPQALDGKCVIDTEGTVSHYSFEQALMHEIIHGVMGYTDGANRGVPPNFLTGNYDYVGDTVRTEQIIAGEMSKDSYYDPLFVERASYHSTLSEDQLATLDPFGDFLSDLTGLVLVDDLGEAGIRGGNEIDTRDFSDPVLLVGLSGDDVIHAGSGNDYLYGGTGGDKLFGGDGDDYLAGNSYSDKLFGEAGSDYILGGADDDILIGGAGNPDQLNLSTLHSEWYDGEVDFLRGGDGFDTYYIFATEGYYGGVQSSQITWDAIEKSDWLDKSDNDFVANIQIVQDNVWANFVLTSEMVAAALSGYSGDPYLIGLATFNTGGGSFQEEVLGKMVDDFFVVYTEVNDAKKILCVFPSLPEPEQQLIADPSSPDGFELWQSAQRSFDADLLLV